MTSLYIPVTDCKVGHIYTLNSRNLDFGAFTIQNTFIGLRTKFDDTFLDDELHHDLGGTASPLKEISVLPNTIPLKLDLGSYDLVTKEDVAFDKPVADGGKGWYFIKDGKSSKNIRPCRKFNKELFEYLQNLKVNL